MKLKEKNFYQIDYVDYNRNDIFWRDFSRLPNNPYILNTDMSQFKCLFVFMTTQQDEFSGNDYPISLGYMASLLRMNGAKATISFQNIEVYDGSIYSGYDLICFYPMASLLLQVLDLASKVKNDYPTSKLCFFNSEQHQHEMILCSPEAKDFAKNLMERNKTIDYILVGEAEYAFLKLCEKLVTKDENFNGIPACLYRQNEKVKISGKPIESVNFEYLPFPSRDFLEKGISKEGLNKYSPRVQSSRGCLSRCLYCAESTSNITRNGRKNPWLGRNIIKFVDEIEMLSKHYGVIFFNVIDSSFEDPGLKGIKRIKQFCNEVINRKIQASFKIHLRVETIGKLNDEFLLLLKEAGVDVIVAGIESGLDWELKSYKKITTAKKNIEFIQRLDTFGKFFTLLGHMMFSPSLRLEDLPKKVNFLKEIHRGWDYLDLSNNLLVFKGTAYHNHINEIGLALDTNRLSATVPYQYKDGRVRYIANELGDLKIKCPEVITLHNLQYDSMNMLSRYYNKMNQHLWKDEKLFGEYKEGLNKIFLEVEEIYAQYFLGLVDIAGTGWSQKNADLLYSKWIEKSIPSLTNKIEGVIANFIMGYEDKGLSTSKLYLKTWLSLINTQINTSVGKVE